MSKQQQIEECQRQLAEVQEKLERLKQEQEQYIIPFQFEGGCGSGGDCIGIPFNDNSQVLFYSSNRQIWKVLDCETGNLMTRRLADEPTPFGELKVGYTYFELLKGQAIEERVGRKFQYFKYLGNKQAYVEEECGVMVDSISTECTYYQVIPVED